MKTKFVIFITVLFALPLWAESILSSFGIGIPYGTTNTQQMSMGNFSLAHADKYAINSINPSATYQLRETTFSIHYIYEATTSEDGTFKESSSYSNYHGFSFYIPLGPKFGFNFGIAPETRINYYLTFDGSVNNETFTKTVSSLGGLNKFYISVAMNPASSLSVSLSGLAYFGKSEDTWRLQYDNSDIPFYDSHDRLSTFMKGLNFGLSAHYHPSQKWSLGAIFRPNVSLNTETSVVSYIRQSTDEKKGSVTYPGQWGIGGQYWIRSNWLLGMDFIQNQWDAFKINDLNVDHIQSVQQISIGSEWRPQEKLHKPYIQRMAYRIGLLFQPLVSTDPSGKDLREIWATCGLGLPLFQNKSQIDIGLAFGKRGNLDTNGYVENLFRLSLSLNGSEKWFIKTY